ncbi:MAG: lysylphosphatidylglycerol synthase transmembrane domain-containing protein, partial [Verrucomicrobiota bacterium]
MNLKKAFLTILQAVVTLGLLWFIFHDKSKREQMVLALGKADPLWLIPGFLCFGLVLLCGALRWQLLMRVQGIHLGLFRVWQLVMIGMFYNLFLPGGTGGD